MWHSFQSSDCSYRHPCFVQEEEGTEAPEGTEATEGTPVNGTLVSE